MQVDILITGSTTAKGRELLESLYTTAQRCGVKARPITAANATPDRIVMLYGAGGSDRFPVMNRLLAAGGHVIAWDAGYWNRAGDNQRRKYRLSIDALHPQAMVMTGPRPDHIRWKQSGLDIAAEGGSAKGPVMLVGCSPKSNAIGANGWAASKSREIRKVWPGRKILYRPKPKRPNDAGVLFDETSKGPIAEALARVSLVVARHSNVAVDACRAGVPVVCDDGAAAAIYPSALADYTAQPTPETRREFLERLAWWQWAPNEAAQCWPWLVAQMGRVK